MTCKVENVKNGWKYTLNRTPNDRSYKTVPYFIITVKPHWYGHWRGHRKCPYQAGSVIKVKNYTLFYRNTTASHLTSLNITKLLFCRLCPWKHTEVSRKSIQNYVAFTNSIDAKMVYYSCAQFIHFGVLWCWKHGHDVN